MRADFNIMGAEFNLCFFVGIALPTGMAVISTAALLAHPTIGSTHSPMNCVSPAAIRRTAMS